jgi:hypothetical protein
MKNDYRMQRLLLFAPIVFLLLTLSCATTGNVLTTHPAGEGGMVPGSYTAVLYSSSEYNFLQTIAFLDPEEDAHEIVPYGAQFNYSVVNGLSPAGAEQRARQFIASHAPSYNSIDLRAIKGVDGNTIGYELRPWYMPINYGESDVLDITYVPPQPDGRVTVYVGLKMSVERRLERDRRR